jgi:hypothetical protein
MSFVNKAPCPACGKPLRWNGIVRSATKTNLEGKRWYQYAAPRIYCKYCGARLRGPMEGHEGWLLLAWFVFVFVLNPFIIQRSWKRLLQLLLSLGWLGSAIVYLVFFYP